MIVENAYLQMKHAYVKVVSLIVLVYVMGKQP